MRPHPRPHAITERDKNMEALHILTDDGHMLAGRCFRPQGGVNVRRAVIIACALGVPQTFYERAASWLVLGMIYFRLASFETLGSV